MTGEASSAADGAVGNELARSSMMSISFFSKTALALRTSRGNTRQLVGLGGLQCVPDIRLCRYNVLLGNDPCWHVDEFADGLP